MHGSFSGEGAGADPVASLAAVISETKSSHEPVPVDREVLSHAASLHGVEQTTCASGGGGGSQPRHCQLGSRTSSSVLGEGKRTET